MNLQEAQQFVRQFDTGEYAPEEHAAFLRWTMQATVNELEVIGDLHESMHGKWLLPEGPTAEWVMQMEKKLDQVGVTEMDDREEGMDGREDVPENGEWAGAVGMRPKRIFQWNSWMAAAAVVATLAAGTYLYVEWMGPKMDDRVRQETLLSMRLVNPRGGSQKELILADGSKIWLNAGSELKYPGQFTGTERVVELKGEAFFDVAGRSGNPFKVLIKDAEVDVLGTYFTIMAYDDEPISLTTVVEGSVEVASGGVTRQLKSGDQAEITYSSPGVEAMAVRSGINPARVLAWKGGIYHFEGRELYAVMREVARAYDVTVQYRPNVGNVPISGSLDLNKSLDFNLKLIEAIVLNKIKFNHHGKIVIASPA